MTDTIDMVFSNCVEWFRDWVDTNPPNLADEWDVAQWMETEMTEATKTFLEFGFRTAKARNDALTILRSLYYEYFLFQRGTQINALQQNLVAVERLPKLPQSDQKSTAWHAEARELLSGAEFGPICVGSPSEWNTVLAKKCAPLPTSLAEESPVQSRTVYLSNDDGLLSSFRWGWRFEPVARQVFETEVAKGTVYDGLGRIRHPTLPGLGASPDGLIMTGPRSGRLVEIKCPISRELDGEVPIRYYCQMQLQAEVCDVEAVEYFEVQFGQILQTHVTDDILERGEGSWIGKVCVVGATPDTPPEKYEYAYSPVFPANKKGLKDCLKWSAPNTTFESAVWYIKDSFHKTVLRNRRWWISVGQPSYERFWAEVAVARADKRFKAKPLFVDTDSEQEMLPPLSAEDEEEEPYFVSEAEEEEIARTSDDAEDVTDENTNDEDKDETSTDVEMKQ